MRRLLKASTAGPWVNQPTAQLCRVAVGEVSHSALARLETLKDNTSLTSAARRALGTQFAALFEAGQPISVRIPQACALTGLGRTTLYEAIRAGQLPIRKKGRVTLVLTEDLITFVQRLPQPLAQVAAR
jgi:excisionase family DNA binding protein